MEKESNGIIRTIIAAAIIALIVICCSCSASKRAERKKQRDMEKFGELLSTYPQITDTVVVTVIDTLIVPEKVIEYRVAYKYDTVYVEKAIDSTLDKLKGAIDDAQRLTLARDIRTIVVESKTMKDTTLVIDGNEITFRNGAVTHKKLEEKFVYTKAETSINVKPVIDERRTAYQYPWFWILVLIIGLLLFLIVKIVNSYDRR